MARRRPTPTTERHNPTQPAPQPLRNLSPLEQAFVREYCANPTPAYAAAVRAGYAASGAAQQASILLKRPHVAAAIARERAVIQERTTVDAVWLVSRLSVEAQGLGPDTTSAARVAACKELARLLGLGEGVVRSTPGTVVNLITTIRDGDLALARALLSGEALPAQPKIVQVLAPRDDRPLAPPLSESALLPALPPPADATPALAADCARGEGGVEGDPVCVFSTKGELVDLDPAQDFSKVDAPSGCDIFPTEFGDPVDPLRVFREELLDGGENVG